jgi:apolipoprotein N-acyltransferase
VAIQHLLLDYRGNVLLGSMTWDPVTNKRSDYYNSAILFSDLYFPNYSIKQYNKIYLVVYGEYTPLADDFPVIRDWLQISDFKRGTHAEDFTIEGSSLTVSPLICFEDTVPEVVDGAARLHPSFLATISDDAWYRGWCATWGVNQHFENARFRCVEHDLPLLRCGNSGLTCLIDQNGELVAKFVAKNGKSIDEEGLFNGVIHPYPSHGTLYERFGNQLLLIFNVITIILTVRFFVARESPARRSLFLGHRSIF